MTGVGYWRASHVIELRELAMQRAQSLEPDRSSQYLQHAAGAPHDGFLVEQSAVGLSLIGRIARLEYRLDALTDGDGCRYIDGTVAVRVSEDGSFSTDSARVPPRTVHLVDVGRYHVLATLLRGITDTTRIHAINAPFVAVNQTNLFL